MLEIVRVWFTRPLCSVQDFQKAVDYAKENTDMNNDGSVSVYEMLRAIIKYIILNKW